MNKFDFFAIIVCLVIMTCVFEAVGQCSNDNDCTDLCGYAGAGKCINGTHCECATCPQRSTAEISLAYALKVCSPEPFCQLRCPMPTFSFTKGKFYTGHVCVGGGTNGLVGLTCICFCMPTTLASLATVISCPVLPNITALTG